MSPRTERAIALAAVLLASTAARADELIASGSKTELWIEKLAGARVEAVYQEPLFTPGGFGAWEWGWTDPHTLWVLRRDGDKDVAHKITVVKIVDGKPEPERELTLADFKLTADPDPTGKAIDWDAGDPGLPHLIATRGHGVWVQRMTKLVKRGDGTRDFRLGYLRIDRAAPLATARPASDTVPELPAVKAPAGYSATLVTRKIQRFTLAGMVCKGPNASFAVPDFVTADPATADDIPGAILADQAATVVQKIEWVSATPPVLRVRTKIRGALATTYVLACKDRQPAPQVLGDGRWVDQATIRTADGHEVAKLRGGDSPAVAR